MGILGILFGSYSKRELKRIEPIKNAVLALEEEYKALSDVELKAKTLEFRKRLGVLTEELGDEKNKDDETLTTVLSEVQQVETLDAVLPEALAAIREATDRVLHKRPYPVQIIGAIVLHQGRIAEMKTGEGKTIVAMLASYVNALTAQGVHVVTVNEYLAKTQSEEMGKVLRFMGLTVGCILARQGNHKKAYACDVTYGTNSEFGFDYLRDNMAKSADAQAQRTPNFSIVDEVDSILIDEARTPLIISGPGDKSSDMYKQVNMFVKRLKAKVITEMDDKQDQEELIAQNNEDADYIVDEKAKNATLSKQGVEKAEEWFKVVNLMDLENSELLHHINQAIKAYGTMHLDVNYIIQDGEIMIVDEFTGRVLPGRRYSEGLHQAIEAKEGVEIKEETKTIATITYQNYFRLYKKLSGMTGTAMTEEAEFREIYKLDVIAIPTNRPVARIDHNDKIFATVEDKYRQIIRQIVACHEKNQPVLVGTVDIEKSELISKLLRPTGIKHNVLNAKQNEREAEIVAQAGKLGAVTIATNMAGRGTDIILGGNSEFIARSELRRSKFVEHLVIEKRNAEKAPKTEEENSSNNDKKLTSNKKNTKHIPRHTDTLTDEQEAESIKAQVDFVINEAIGFADTSDELILKAREEYKRLLEKYDAQVKKDAEEVVSTGGLYIIGTERHESRRIDNQLRGRSGRQGDPGESCFFISMDDDLMRIFGKPVKGIQGLFKSAMDKVESENEKDRAKGKDVSDDGAYLNASILSRTFENAQKKVEGNNFNIRKNVLKFDDVMNSQREIIYGERRKVLNGEDMHAFVLNMLKTVVEKKVGEYILSDVDRESWNFEGLRSFFLDWVLEENDLVYEVDDLDMLEIGDIINFVLGKATEKLNSQVELFGEEFKEIERFVILDCVDRNWMSHIDDMDHLKRAVNLRSYAQKQPVVEYRMEGFEMFDAMVENIQVEVIRILLNVTKKVERPQAPPPSTITPPGNFRGHGHRGVNYRPGSAGGSKQGVQGGQGGQVGQGGQATPAKGQSTPKKSAPFADKSQKENDENK